MEKYVLSQMTGKNFSKAVAAIYLQTTYNQDQYPEYLKWFYTVNLPRIFKKEGDIIFYLDGLEIVSLATLKNKDEKKICTLLVNEDYRKKGYSKQILEDSFEYLQTDTPLITIPTKRLKEFNKIIEAYNWKETDRTGEYYSEEVIFNAPKVLRK